MKIVQWDYKKIDSGFRVFKGAVNFDVDNNADLLVNLLNEGDMHRSMCRRVAVELGEHWEAHCDGSGYGPVNLMNRLSGEMPPDYYPGYID